VAATEAANSAALSGAAAAAAARAGADDDDGGRAAPVVALVVAGAAVAAAMRSARRSIGNVVESPVQARQCKMFMPWMGASSTGPAGLSTPAAATVDDADIPAGVGTHSVS
jgi:hypothetical protein